MQTLPHQVCTVLVKDWASYIAQVIALTNAKMQDSSVDRVDATDKVATITITGKFLFTGK